MPHREPPRPPVVLVIRDGWGQNPHDDEDTFNAVKLAHTPVDDMLRREWPWTLMKTCGEDVGLPLGVMGNSEVGHQNIGAGRIVDQELMRISRAVRDGSFLSNNSLRGALGHAEQNSSNLHIMGLVSDGKVHSDLEHLFALIDLAANEGFARERLFVHVFTDGRDTGPRMGIGFVEQLETKLKQAGAGRIATVIGRYYAMDRDHRWDRVARAYRALTARGGEPVQVNCAPTAIDAVQQYYKNPSDSARQGDEFITPTQIVDVEGRPIARISDHDAVIFFNFRGDRPREITRAFVLDDTEWDAIEKGGFDRGNRLNDLYFCTMSAYEEGLPVSAVAFQKPPKMESILGDVVSRAGLSQFRCAETEKFAHVTFFFNDYREEPFPGEMRLLLPSPQDVTTYDQKPEMSAFDVCAGVLDRLHAERCDSLMVVNFANPDMVGHTGSLEATIKAVETVDECVGQVVAAACERDGSLIITADHGNAEQMWNHDQNCPHTAHTVFDVPLHVVGGESAGRSLRSGSRLADIAPTVLDLMKLDKPAEMTGHSVLMPEG